MYHLVPFIKTRYLSEPCNSPSGITNLTLQWENWDSHGYSIGSQNHRNNSGHPEGNTVFTQLASLSASLNLPSRVLKSKQLWVEFSFSRVCWTCEFICFFKILHLNLRIRRLFIKRQNVQHSITLISFCFDTSLQNSVLLSSVNSNTLNSVCVSAWCISELSW